MQWVVIERAAYAAWIISSSPSLKEEQEMLAWFAYLEDQPTPPSVDARTQSGLLVTTGPNGEDVVFSLQRDGDPGGDIGAIVIRRITRHPSGYQ